MKLYLVVWNNNTKSVIPARNLKHAMYKADSIGNPYIADFYLIINSDLYLDEVIFDNLKIKKGKINCNIEKLDCINLSTKKISDKTVWKTKIN